MHVCMYLWIYVWLNVCLSVCLYMSTVNEFVHIHNCPYLCIHDPSPPSRLSDYPVIRIVQLSTAMMGRFSSDRTIHEYARNLWHIQVSKYPLISASRWVKFWRRILTWMTLSLSIRVCDWVCILIYMCTCMCMCMCMCMCVFTHFNVYGCYRLCKYIYNVSLAISGSTISLMSNFFFAGSPWLPEGGDDVIVLSHLTSANLSLLPLS